MTKKIGLILVLVFCAGLLFAQEEDSGPKEIKNAFSMDVFPMIKGFIASENEDDYKISFFNLALAYERLIVPRFSIGGEMDLFFGTFDVGSTYRATYFALLGQVRWYLIEDFQKVFVGADIGFNNLSADTALKDAGMKFTGLITAVKIGYKIQYTGIYFEPSMSYVLSKYAGSYEFIGFSVTPVGWQGGFRIGYAF
jgi:hypothetical protein